MKRSVLNALTDPHPNRKERFKVEAAKTLLSLYPTVNPSRERALVLLTLTWRSSGLILPETISAAYNRISCFANDVVQIWMYLKGIEE